MSHLLRKPFGTHGKVHDITPQSAGWRYVGFALHRLRAGEEVAEATAAREVILVMVEGKAAFSAAGQDWGTLGNRMDVFEKTRPIACMSPMAMNGGLWRKPIAPSRSVPRRAWAGMRRGASGRRVLP